MAQPKIDILTPEQEALIPVYLEKWRSVALSTLAIDRKQAALAIKATYAFSGLLEPEILFFDSPYGAWSYFFKERPFHWGRTVGHVIHHGLKSRVHYIDQDKIESWSSLDKYLWHKLVDGLLDDVFQVTDAVEKQLRNQLTHLVEPPFTNFVRAMIRPEEWACRSSYFDFCISVLNCDCEPWEWIAYREVAKNCGWILPTTKVCIICERPTKLSFDNSRRLHAQGEPAIQFVDGFSIYAHYGPMALK